MADRISDGNISGIDVSISGEDFKFSGERIFTGWFGQDDALFHEPDRKRTVYRYCTGIYHVRSFDYEQDSIFDLSYDLSLIHISEPTRL